MDGGAEALPDELIALAGADEASAGALVDQVCMSSAGIGSCSALTNRVGIFARPRHGCAGIPHAGGGKSPPVFDKSDNRPCPSFSIAQLTGTLSFNRDGNN